MTATSLPRWRNSSKSESKLRRAIVEARERMPSSDCKPFVQMRLGAGLESAETSEDRDRSSPHSPMHTPSRQAPLHKCRCSATMEPLLASKEKALSDFPIVG